MRGGRRVSLRRAQVAWFETISDGTSLFASSDSGLTRWNPGDGSQTGELSGFRPAHHHRGARELAQVVGKGLVRWGTEEG